VWLELLAGINEINSSIVRSIFRSTFYLKIQTLLPLLNEDHKKQILAQTITSVDRQDTAFLNYKKKHKEITKADFLDLIQYGEIQIDDYLPEEMKRQKKINDVKDLDAA